MFAQTFRFNTDQFQSRVRAAFAPRKPRHRLVRFALGVLGLGLLALLVVFGVAVGALMLAAGLVYRLVQQRRKPVANQAGAAHVVDAEYRVIGKPLLDR